MTFLRSQILDWNDLSLAMQEAAYAVWCNYGQDAARVFCQGA